MDSINLNPDKRDLDLSITDDGRFRETDTINLQRGDDKHKVDDLDLNLISNPTMRSSEPRRPNYSSDEDDGYRRRGGYDDDDDDDDDDDLELPPDFDDEDDEDDRRHHHSSSSRRDRRDSRDSRDSHDSRGRRESRYEDDRHSPRDDNSDYDDDRDSHYSDREEEEEQPHRMTYEEILKEKLKLIRRSRILRSRGYLPQTSNNRDWTVMDDYEEMKMEVEARDRMYRDDKSLGWWRQGTSWFSTGIQWANDKFDPVGVNITGFADDMDDELEKGEFDDIFLELDEKYSDKVKMAPEVRLVFGVGQIMGRRAFMNHFGRQMAPDLRTVVENNPDIMNRIMEASHDQFRRDAGMAPSAHGLGNMGVPTAPTPPTREPQQTPEDDAIMREMMDKAHAPRMSAQNRLRPPTSSTNRPVTNTNLPTAHHPPGQNNGGNRIAPRPEQSAPLNREGGMSRAGQLHGVLGKLGAEVDDMSDASDDSARHQPRRRPPPTRTGNKIGNRSGQRTTSRPGGGRTLELNFEK